MNVTVGMGNGEPSDFSDGAREQFRFTVAAWMYGGAPRADVEAAVNRLCEEGHARKIPVEQLLMLTRAVWERISAGRSEARNDKMLDEALKMCADAYEHSRKTDDDD